MGFNTRRASNFIQFDYLRPTVSSMQRAKSVVPQKQRGGKDKKAVAQQNMGE